MPLHNKPQNVPDVVGVYVGALDDPSGFKPQIIMLASRGRLALLKFPNMRPF